jgi:hypothetical protein
LRHPASFAVDAWNKFKSLRESTLKTPRAWGFKGNRDDAVHISLHHFGAILLSTMVRLGFAVSAETDD